MSDVDERIEEAVKEAEYAFWEVIAQKFPEATHGDMYPDACINFSVYCENVAKIWVASNTNLLPDHWASEDDEE